MDTVGVLDDRYTAERYFQLVADGVLRADDRVELLDGVIVAMPPSGPPHATATSKVLLTPASCGRASRGRRAAP